MSVKLGNRNRFKESEIIQNVQHIMLKLRYGLIQIIRLLPKGDLRRCYEGVPEVIACACATGYDVTGSCITGNREPEMKGR
jgi:hypothetical protein